MSRPAGLLVCLVLGFVSAVALVAHRPGPEAAPRTPALPPGPLTFAPGTHPGDVRLVTDALERVRPEARRLIGRVTGATTVRIAALSDAAGLAEPQGDRYLVTLDLRAVAAQGARAVRRLVVHELAHVVDHALVPDALKARLDAATPTGWGCDAGHRGACAPRAERFAESFAKWATGDLGEGVHLGYAVPPPPPSWGEPLGALR